MSFLPTPITCPPHFGGLCVFPFPCCLPKPLDLALYIIHTLWCTPAIRPANESPNHRITKRQVYITPPELNAIQPALPDIRMLVSSISGGARSTGARMGWILPPNECLSTGPDYQTNGINRLVFCI